MCINYYIVYNIIEIDAFHASPLLKNMFLSSLKTFSLINHILMICVYIHTVIFYSSITRSFRPKSYYCLLISSVLLMNV